MTRRELDGRVPLIGFAGAPFTLASYAIEGGPSRDFARTKALMYGHPEAWHRLCDRLAQVVSAFVVAQVEAGAQAIQIFDSWVGALSAEDYREFASPHTAKVFAALKATDVPTIHFGTGTSTILPDLAAAGGDVIGVDWRLPIDVAWEQLGAHLRRPGQPRPDAPARPAPSHAPRRRGRPAAGGRAARPHLQPRSRHPARVAARARPGARPVRARVPRQLTRALVAADAAPIAVDVAVVGGGLAGLTLARDVHRRGRTPLVLEARPAARRRHPFRARRRRAGRRRAGRDAGAEAGRAGALPRARAGRRDRLDRIAAHRVRAGRRPAARLPARHAARPAADARRGRGPDDALRRGARPRRP